MRLRCPYCGHRHDQWVLDLFCGAGGAAMGYHRAGFGCVGVDNRSQPHYPFAFVQGDALAPPVSLSDFDVIHASPPCQRWAVGGASRSIGDGHPDFLTPMQRWLPTTGKSFVIENVPTSPMPDGILLCGSTFGLPIVRHRRFEIHPTPILVPSLCRAKRFGRATRHGPGYFPYARGSWEAAWKEHVLPTVWPWMTIGEAGEAIPPAYTEYIGSVL